MPVPSQADFIDAVRQFRLLEPVQLDEMDNLRAAFPAARDLAAELIRRGWLTKYQINQLTQGRGKKLLLGSYILLDRLGEGGMGEVFKARNWKLGRIVALKLIRKERINNPDAVRRFRREIRAAAQLDHPHIVRALDADEVAGAHIFVMEYVQGTDLAKLVKQNGPLPVDKACDYARQTALGLQHACERGMVHRDIKPPNLLVTPAGVVKILDMGLARLDRKADDESATMTREGAVMGTLDYISPEQAMDSHDVDIRADLYSLGCTLYFLLTGKVPFPGGEALQKLLKHRLEEPIPVERHRRDVPPSVAAAVRKLMAKQPDDRYQTPAEAAAALTSALDQESQTGELAASVSATQAITGAIEANGAAIGWSSVVSARSANQPPAPRRPRPPLRIQPPLLIGAAIGAIVLGLGLVALFRLLPREPRPATSPIRPAVAIIDKVTPKASALSATEQIARLVAELKRLNPGFDGTVKPTIKDDVVVGLEFLTDDVTDISPVRELAGLRGINCSGSWGGGSLVDLSPLKDMKLDSLVCAWSKVSDLTPLKDMKLTYLNCSGAPVSDLTPLKDMKLIHLECWSTQVADLSPLKDMQLTYLQCSATKVADLKPLMDMKLKFLNCAHTRTSDLTPLRGMPLGELSCDFQAKRDAEILRSIKTLKKINDQPAADFWKKQDADRAEFDAWCKKVAALPALQQVVNVDASLMRRNPGFNGSVTPKIENGVVVELEFRTDKVTDLSPVLALTGLRSLNCRGSNLGKGSLSDLAPLKGLLLTSLDCKDTKVSNLAPLAGMPLTRLTCDGTLVADLSPLKDMKLAYLSCSGTPVSDLSPLKGMPLARFFCHYTRVSDLAPLQGAPLTCLFCNHAPITDLAPLRGMSLQELKCDFDPKRDADILRSIPTLQRINAQPAADFWKDVDKEQAEFQAWCKHVAALSAEDQARAVAAKLKELNPGFDGTVKPTIEGGVVTGLEFRTDNITNTSPVQALVGLRRLACIGGWPRKGRLSDLSPLARLRNLTCLNCNENRIHDLAPLRELPLTELHADGGAFDDLRPLEGMRLTYLSLSGTSPVGDLSPLKGMPLRVLGCNATHVADLSPLVGMPLEELLCDNSLVKDLSLLKNLSLKRLNCDFNPVRDAAILRSIKTLEKINGQPTADFWKEVDKPRAALEPWYKEVALLPADKQVKAVAAKLKELNPGFDGAVKPTVENGVVTGLEFATDMITDISPVRALTGLKRLRCNADHSRKGRLSDLSPLKGMNIANLDCNNNRVPDLSPLKGTPLTELHCNGNKISDLGPLTGLQLTFLDCGGNPITDLSPLKGMPLEMLWCHYAAVSDLTPLRGTPLKQILCDFNAERDAGILHSIKTLERINGKPTADFWKDVDKGPTTFDGWRQEVAAMPVDKQVEAVAAKLKELNPDFEGAVKPVIDAGVITGLTFISDQVTDVSPVRALEGLKSLHCAGSGWGKGKLSSLSSLKGAALSSLNCSNNKLSDLSPLMGMPLTDLNCNGNSISDLKPLAGMELTSLDCGGTPLSDLSPLKGMPLKMLFCHYTSVSDLTPLKGMNLGKLFCRHTAVTDLTPLKDVKLTYLNCSDTAVTDLTPLKDLQLTALDCSNTKITDLAPLKDMKLTMLNCAGAKVSDLAPLRGMRLKNLDCDFDAKRDAEILRSIPTLAKINDKPAAEFWQDVDAKRP